LCEILHDGGGGRKRDFCQFKAPWRLVERIMFTADGVLLIWRSHSVVNWWNKAIAVGLRHNHDISFVATQYKTIAVVFYVTNYATKVESPVCTGLWHTPWREPGALLDGTCLDDERN
jgi:hypothetical protein